MFDAERMLQEVCYLLKLNGGRMSRKKLMCELYLIERLSIDERESSVSHDRSFYTDNEVILSFTLNLLLCIPYNFWGDYLETVQTRNCYPDILLKKENKTDLLSEKDKEYINKSFFENYNLTDYLLEDRIINLPECRSLRGHFPKITFADIMRALNRSEEEIAEAEEEYRFFKKL